MVDMKKAKELFREITREGFKALKEAHESTLEMEEKLKEARGRQEEAAKLIKEAFAQLETNVICFEKHGEMCYIVRLVDGKITIESTHIVNYY